MIDVHVKIALNRPAKKTLSRAKDLTIGYTAFRLAVYPAVSSFFYVLDRIQAQKNHGLSRGRELRNIYNSTITNFDNLVKDLFCVIQKPTISLLSRLI